jgi:hypothetical protein
MILYSVTDIADDVLYTSKYSAAIFASGFEERCTYFPKKTPNYNIENAIVFGFKEGRECKQREANDRYYLDNWVNDIIITSSGDETPIYDVLNSIKYNKSDDIRLLVDYTSMSRLWYAGILNWSRFAQNFKTITIDMVYSPGIHREKTEPMVIKNILSIPGCEGGAVPLFKSVAVFGLGFDGLAPLCVLEKLEPDLYYVYFASPTIFPDYPNKVRKENQELIRDAKGVLELPLSSVEKTFAHLGEIVSLHKSEADITFVPMGPKPHVLAAILLSLRFEEVACLRVSNKKVNSFANISTNGQLVSTSVVFKDIKIY